MLSNAAPNLAIWILGPSLFEEATTQREFRAHWRGWQFFWLGGFYLQLKNQLSKLFEVWNFQGHELPLYKSSWQLGSQFTCRPTVWIRPVLNPWNPTDSRRDSWWHKRGTFDLAKLVTDGVLDPPGLMGNTQDGTAPFHFSISCSSKNELQVRKDNWNPVSNTFKKEENQTCQLPKFIPNATGAGTTVVEPTGFMSELLESEQMPQEETVEGVQLKRIGVQLKRIINKQQPYRVLQSPLIC